MEAPVAGFTFAHRARCATEIFCRATAFSKWDGCRGIECNGFCNTYEYAKVQFGCSMVTIGNSTPFKPPDLKGRMFDFPSVAHVFFFRIPEAKMTLFALLPFLPSVASFSVLSGDLHRHRTQQPNNLPSRMTSPNPSRRVLAARSSLRRETFSEWLKPCLRTSIPTSPQAAISTVSGASANR